MRRSRQTLATARTTGWSLLFCVMVVAHLPSVQAQDDPILARNAIAPTGACNTDDITSHTDSERANPTWYPILDPQFLLFPKDPPTVLEGFVPNPDQKYGDRIQREGAGSQAPAEVSEEELPWNHYTHDRTFDVIPDFGYRHLLSGFKRPDGTVQALKAVMEGEWESASTMDDNRTWGGLPEFAWPSVGDRLWVEGRWVFDCGHTGLEDANIFSLADVQYESEIHPPRALVTFRLNHPVSSGSWLPLTGKQTDVPVTEADIFVSGNGGGANDLCSVFMPATIVTDGYNICSDTPAVIPIIDRNYVFDIYPPGTDYTLTDSNRVFAVNPPRPGASLQWRFVDQSSQVPAHTAGIDSAALRTVTPILCPIDEATPAPDQSESSCPPLPARPTRLRVILPFRNTKGTFFAQSILLGWDDVPSTPFCKATGPLPPYSSTETFRTACAPVRKFEIRLHEFRVLHTRAFLLPVRFVDWRVFVDVAGQSRYMSDQPFETDSACNESPAGSGLLTRPPYSLSSVKEGDCFRFDGLPWSVSLQDGIPLDIAVGGFNFNGSLEDDFCRNISGCRFGGLSQGLDLIFSSFSRIGTFEFDFNPPDYKTPAVYTSHANLDRIPCSSQTGAGSSTSVTCVNDQTGVSQYQVTFTISEVPPPSPPIGTMNLATPRYTDIRTGTTYVTSATPLLFSGVSTDVAGFQYSFQRESTTSPTSPASFPVRWNSAGFEPVFPGTSSHIGTFLSAGPSVSFVEGTFEPVFLDASDRFDGEYQLHFSAYSPTGLMEARHTIRLTLDTTPPRISIAQPAGIEYLHSAVLTLKYGVEDGLGSGVKGVTILIDGSTTAAGYELRNGQSIGLLSALEIGAHTLTIRASDNLGNASTSSVLFTIVATPDSLVEDVKQFVRTGKITKRFANSLLATLRSASASCAKRACTKSTQIYASVIAELQEGKRKNVDDRAASIMVADVQYVIGTLVGKK
jgi:hypothetical protein